jgi:hypothetical protein
LWVALSIVAHVLLVGLPIAIFTRRARWHDWESCCIPALDLWGTEVRSDAGERGDAWTVNTVIIGD